MIFFLLNWALNSFCSSTSSPTSFVRSRISYSIGRLAVMVEVETKRHIVDMEEVHKLG